MKFIDDFCSRFRFELTVSDDKVVPMDDLLTVLVLRSKTGVRINITPRNHNHTSQPVPGWEHLNADGIRTC